MFSPSPGLAAQITHYCIIGSQAHGLATDVFDIDRCGIYSPGADLHWSPEGAPHQIKNSEKQECY